MKDDEHALFDKSEFTILLIDDSYSQRELISSMLSTVGYRVITAETGEIGLIEIEHRVFDLILLDIVMPDISGFQIIEVIKKLKINEHTPIIFLTALSDAKEIVKGFHLGANDYVLKPFEKEVLLARIELQLKLNRTMEALQTEILAKQKIIAKYEEQKKELSELNKTKDKIFSVLVHDIKNQINGVFGLSKMMLDSNAKIDEKKQKHFIRMIYSSSIAINEFVENINGWVKRNNKRCEQELIEVMPIVVEYIGMYKTVADSKNTNIDIQLEDVAVLFDKNMLRSIVKNLISNAVKFTEYGGDITIILRSVDSNRAEFIVQDSGVGISSEIVMKLFEEDDYKKPNEPGCETGTNLGLKLCRLYLEQNGGTINVESELGKGTKMTVGLSKSIG